MNSDKLKNKYFEKAKKRTAKRLSKVLNSLKKGDMQEMKKEIIELTYKNSKTT